MPSTQRLIACAAGAACAGVDSFAEPLLPGESWAHPVFLLLLAAACSSAGRRADSLRAAARLALAATAGGAGVLIAVASSRASAEHLGINLMVSIAVCLLALFLSEVTALNAFYWSARQRGRRRCSGRCPLL